MKVVYFVGTLEAGGLERFVTRVSIQAKKSDIFVPIVICLHKRKGIFVEELERNGIEAYQAPERWSRSLWQAWKLISLIRQLQPDIVHSQVNFSLVQQFCIARFAGVLFTVTERNCYHRAGLALVRRRLQYAVLKLFSVRYSANSGRVAAHLASMLNEKISRFEILNNGLDVPAYPIFHERNGGNKQPVRITYVARMAQHKGHLFFLEVLAELIFKRGLLCEGVLIGDGPLRVEIEAAIKRLNLVGYVHLTGVVSNVEDYLQQTDIVSLLSEFEGMPNVVLEGMAAGKPVVATDVGNSSELLEGAGVVLKQRSVEEATTAFSKLIVDPQLRTVLGTEGRNRIERDYSIRNTVDRLNKYYKTIIQ